MSEIWPSDESILGSFASLLWGDLHSRQATFPITISLSTRLSLNEMARELVVVVRVHPHHRQWAGKTYAVRAQDIVIRQLIPERDIYMKSVRDALINVSRRIETLLPTGVAPRLFEVDPRIGQEVLVERIGQEVLVEETEGGVPVLGRNWISCPLFDPPGGVYLPEHHVDFPRDHRHHNKWARCGKCKTPFRLGDMVFWGGGYLLWVCYSCVHPR